MDTPPRKWVQAKDIPDDVMLAAIAQGKATNGYWTSWMWLCENVFTDLPAKVVLAKCRALLRKGKITGCGCGCRGDFEVVQ